MSHALTLLSPLIAVREKAVDATDSDAWMVGLACLET